MKKQSECGERNVPLLLWGKSGAEKTICLLKHGKIVGIKGIGGFHLAADATSEIAVKRLRQKKMRPAKPFAVMMPNMEEIRKYCIVNDIERRLLESPQAPIVLLRKLPKPLHTNLAEAVAPGINSIGVMLPYTPLHNIIMKHIDFPLVMTSGNLSEEPLCKDNNEAVELLSDIADAFLFHSINVVNRIDDSVCFAVGDKQVMIRRARGYAPEPMILKSNSKNILSCGAHYKNTFCLAMNEYALVSQYIGDLDSAKIYQYYKEQIENYKIVFRMEPDFIACDLHNGYLSSYYGKSLGLPVLKVQHHHAHIASVMAEYNIEDKVIGVVYDGTGLGTDGNIWGAEFLIADYKGFTRAGHLKYIPIPGGDFAVKQPYRTALGFIYPHFDYFTEFINRFDKSHVIIIKKQIEQRINTPFTSSMGRLFDAVASTINLRDISSFEGQAAMELESLIIPTGDFYEYDIRIGETGFIIDVFKILSGVYYDFINGIDKGIISAKFHNSIVKFTCDIVCRLKDIYKINKVVLAGGCFQNRFLLEKINTELLRTGFYVPIPSEVPINDGGISLGQTAVAQRYFV